MVDVYRFPIAPGNNIVGCREDRKEVVKDKPILYHSDTLILFPLNREPNFESYKSHQQCQNRDCLRLKPGIK